MTETDDNKEEVKAKTSKLAITTLVLGLLSLSSLLTTRGSALDPLVSLFFPLLAIITGCFGVVVLIKISRKEKDISRSGAVAIVGIIAAVFSVYGPRPRPIPPDLVCGTHLSGLGKAIMVYSNDFNSSYPTAYKWCDLLVQKADVLEKHFICKGALAEGDEGLSHYAMNPNCEPNSPPDTVLLFETKGGWNQYGGAELLTFDNHNGEGCNILFNDTHVSFVTLQYIPTLNWGDEKEN